MANSATPTLGPDPVEIAWPPDLAAFHRLNPSRYPCLLESVAEGSALGRYDLLFAHPQESLRLNPDKNVAQLILCSDYEIAADHEQARIAAASIIGKDPSFSRSNYADDLPYKNIETLQRIIGALREAGLPD